MKYFCCIHLVIFCRALETLQHP